MLRKKRKIATCWNCSVTKGAAAVVLTLQRTWQKNFVKLEVFSGTCNFDNIHSRSDKVTYTSIPLIWKQWTHPTENPNVTCIEDEHHQINLNNFTTDTLILTKIKQKFYF